MEQRPEQTQEITAEQLSELLQIRRDKLAALVAEGKDPFAVIRYDQDTHSADIQASRFSRWWSRLMSHSADCNCR